MAKKTFCDVCDREIKDRVRPDRVNLRFARHTNSSETTFVKFTISSNYTAMDLCLRCIIKNIQKELDEHDPHPKGESVDVRDEEER